MTHAIKTAREPMANQNKPVGNRNCYDCGEPIPAEKLVEQHNAVRCDKCGKAFEVMQ